MSRVNPAAWYVSWKRPARPCLDIGGPTLKKSRKRSAGEVRLRKRLRPRERALLCPLRGPRDRLRIARRFGSKPVRSHPHPLNAREIQPVAVPASHDGGVGGDASSGVGAAGLDEEFQSFRVEMKMPPVKLAGKFRRTCAVLRVMAVVVTAGVVQQGEEHDDIPPETGRGLTEVKTLFQHARPMGCTVQAVPFEAILPPDLDEQAS